MATEALGQVGLFRSTLALMWRYVLQFFRTPQLIFITLVNGVVVVLIFRYVFGGAIKSGNETYVNLLIPAVLLVSAFYAAAQIAVGVAEEKSQGFFDRLKTLPIPRAAPLLARVLAMTVLLTVSYVVNLAVGIGVGFRPSWTVETALAAGAIAIGFAFALAWMFVALGLVARNAQAASGLAVLITPIVFISGAFVPLATMPDWMAPVARDQPFSIVVEATRGLVLANYGNATDPLIAAAWIAAACIIFAPLAVWLYARR